MAYGQITLKTPVLVRSPKLNDKTVLFQTIQFSLSHLFVLNSDPQIIDLTPIRYYQSGPGSNDNKGVLRIPQSLGLTIRLFSVISKTLVMKGAVLPICRDEVGVFYSTNRLGYPQICCILQNFKINTTFFFQLSPYI